MQDCPKLDLTMPLDIIAHGIEISKDKSHLWQLQE